MSTDAGDTWTQIVSTIQATTGVKWPDQAAFASDTADYIYIWGNEGYCKTYESGVLVDHVGDMALAGYERFVGLVGG